MSENSEGRKPLRILFIEAVLDVYKDYGVDASVKKETPTGVFVDMTYGKGQYPAAIDLVFRLRQAFDLSSSPAITVHEPNGRIGFPQSGTACVKIDAQLAPYLDRRALNHFGQRTLGDVVKDLREALQEKFGTVDVRPSAP